MLSTAEDKSNASGHLAVPLNTKCSKKWQIPFLFLSSNLEPTPTIAKAVTDSTPGTGATTTRKPDFKVAISAPSIGGNCISTNTLTQLETLMPNFQCCNFSPFANASQDWHSIFKRLPIGRQV